jgi:hypothetical protein
MSFIFEALKKADKNRKNNEVPNLQTIHQLPVYKPARRPILPLLLGAVLLLNALLLLWIIAPWKKDAPQTGGMASTQPDPGNIRSQIAPPPASPPANRPALVAVDRPPPAAPPAEVSSAAQAPIEKPAPLTAISETRVNSPAENTSLSAIAPLPATEKQANWPVSRTGNTEKEENPVYELAQLPSSVRSEIPSAHMSVHYYTDHSPSRMVRINGQILREGGRLESGPLVEEITPNGVILFFEGYRFLIPRAVPE